MISLNRYKLKHHIKNGNRGAQKASELLKRTDRLIGLILIGNNFANILASSIATILALRFWGDAGIAIATGGLTIVVLIFSEVTPKTLAALHPEKVAFPAAYILSPMLKLFYPLVWIINLITITILNLMGIKTHAGQTDHLSREELKTIVKEAGTMIPKRHQEMLVGILDLEKVTVNDIMIPRNEIVGIDIEDPLDSIIAQLKTSQHTRLPVYKGDINNILGIIHLRNLAGFLTLETPTKAALLQACRDPYFIPESTPLNIQLRHFQKEKRRIAIVVDEYGDVLGIATMEDILEEIVGEFTTDYSSNSTDITPQDDGYFLIDGTSTIRYINRSLGWNLPVDGPKTLSGLITETLESIPENNICLKLHNHRIEIRKIQGNIIKTARVSPPIEESQKATSSTL
jgi:Mg2+/Co2+ transporter CorB